MEYEYLAAWMFLALTILLMAGFPVTFTLMGTAICFGLIGTGFENFSLDAFSFFPTFFDFLPLRIWGVMKNIVLIAVPLFVFMGVTLEKSGLAEELLDTMGMLFGPLRGRPGHQRRGVVGRASGRLHRHSGGHRGHHGPIGRAHHAAPGVTSPSSPPAP